MESRNFVCIRHLTMTRLVEKILTRAGSGATL